MAGEHLNDLAHRTTGMEPADVDKSQVAWEQSSASLGTISRRLTLAAGGVLRGFGKDSLIGQDASDTFTTVANRILDRQKELLAASVALTAAADAMAAAKNAAADPPKHPGTKPQLKTTTGTAADEAEALKTYANDIRGFNDRTHAYDQADEDARRKIEALKKAYAEASTVLAKIHGDPSVGTMAAAIPTPKRLGTDRSRPVHAPTRCRCTDQPAPTPCRTSQDRALSLHPRSRTSPQAHRATSPPCLTTPPGRPAPSPAAFPTARLAVRPIAATEPSVPLCSADPPRPVSSAQPDSQRVFGACWVAGCHPAAPGRSGRAPALPVLVRWAAVATAPERRAVRPTVVLVAAGVVAEPVDAVRPAARARPEVAGAADQAPVPAGSVAARSPMSKRRANASCSTTARTGSTTRARGRASCTDDRRGCRPEHSKEETGVGVRIEVPPGVLKAARQEWETAADDLDGEWRGLHKLATGNLSPEVAAALETFRENWVDQLKSAHGKAERYSEALSSTETDLTATDRDQAELVRDLLPWVYRAAKLEDA